MALSEELITKSTKSTEFEMTDLGRVTFAALGAVVITIALGMWAVKRWMPDRSTRA